MEVTELNQMKAIATTELEVAKKKQNELQKLMEQVEEEVNARQGLIYNLNRLISLKEGKIY